MRTFSPVHTRRAAALFSASALAATALIATAGSASAVITPGGGTNADTTPVFFRDAQGVAVQQCVDAVNCEPIDTTDPTAGPVYLAAEATIGGLIASYELAAVFAEDAAGNPTDQLVVGNSALYRVESGLLPNRRYTIRDPWGTHTCISDGDGVLDNKNCLFEGGGEAGGTVGSGPMKTILRRVGGPAGFLGGLEAAGPVTGSPTGFNRISIKGPGINLSTNQFTVNGQLAANTAMSSVSTDALTMGNKRKTTPSSRVIRVSSFGTARLAAAVTKAGRNPGAFAVTDNCASVASGAACNVRVTYRPQANRTSKAVLRIDDNGLAAPRRVTLTGTGQDTLRARVASSSPRRGQRVGVKKNVSARFNEAVRGVKKSSFQVVDQRNGNKVRGNVSRVGQTNRYVFNPRRNLARGTTYRVRLVGGKAAIRDLAGNPLRTKGWKFRTR